ncbi:IS3 family transposase [Chloroflexota bacterium]
MIRVVELATQYGRYGYRRITALLKREGWTVNHKKVQRIWSGFENQPNYMVLPYTTANDK